MCLFFVKNLGRYRNSIISRISLDPRIGIDYIMLSSDLSAEELTHELLISVILISFKKFVGLKRGAKQNIFRKSPPIIWLAVHRTNNCWRFRKILWPSQNTYINIITSSLACIKWENISTLYGWLKIFKPTIIRETILHPNSSPYFYVLFDNHPSKFNGAIAVYWNWTK